MGAAKYNEQEKHRWFLKKQSDHLLTHSHKPSKVYHIR